MLSIINLLGVKGCTEILPSNNSMMKGEEFGFTFTGLERWKLNRQKVRDMIFSMNGRFSEGRLTAFIKGDVDTFFILMNGVVIGIREYGIITVEDGYYFDPFKRIDHLFKGF